MVEAGYGRNCSQYEGTCSAHLKHLQAATSNSNLTVITNSAIEEQQLSTFFHILKSLSSLISEECLMAVTPFLCQYVYPPCDGNENVKLITQEQCINIRDQVCVSEWKIAMGTKLRSFLPNCEAMDTDNSDISVIREEANISEGVKCHYQFKEYCGVCLPLCGTFSQYTDQVRIGEDIVIICSSVIGAIGAIIMFAVAVKRRKEM